MSSYISQYLDATSFLVVKYKAENFFAFVKFSYSEYENFVTKLNKNIPVNIFKHGELIYAAEKAEPDATEIELVNKLIKFKYGE